MRNRFCGLVCVVTFLLVAFSPALAQGSGGAFLSAPNIDRFPHIDTTLKVFNGQGQFVHGLTAEQVSILEDNNPRPVEGLNEQRVGAQVVVAINPGGAFAIRNAKAISRYDLIKSALRTWALSRSGSTLDDYSLLITNGPAASHTPSSEQWLGSLNSDTTNARSNKPNLDTLFRAVSLAADQPPRPGMGRMVLFITPPPEAQSGDQTLGNLAAQANEQGIPITIWLVSSSGAFSTQAVQDLMQLAANTGGQFFTFTGEESLPSLETYLEPIRYIYQVQYTSGISASGDHAIAARVQVGDAFIDTPATGIGVDLQPPVPAIISPPVEIERKLSKTSPASPQGSQSDADSSPESSVENTSRLAPDETSIQVVFDFPDGRKRDVVYSALVVDGAVVTENLDPPFDQFTWKLDSYASDEVHKLQVQVRDALGLSGSSVEIPVHVTVEKLATNPLGSVQNSLPLLAGLATALAGALLFLIMVVGGKLRPRSQRAASSRRPRSDPVTQPVHIPAEPASHRRPSWVDRFQWPQRQSNTPQAEAYLYPLPEPDTERTIPPIPVPLEGMTIGSDPNQASLVLDDPSVEKRHALLSRLEEGIYRLADEGSVAGTWVNYTPISKEGTCLEQGDLVHIGRIGFRFTLRQPAHTRRPVVISSPASNPSNEVSPEEESAP